MARITGYPDFTRVATPEEIARQLKVIWDALLGLSRDLSAIVVPDLTPLENRVAVLEKQRALAQRQIDAITTGLFQRPGVFISPTGAAAVVAWRAPYPCIVVNVRGFRSGGTGATVNAQRNGTATHLAADLSLTSADVWMDGGAVQNAAYVVGDSFELLLQGVAGVPDFVVIQVDFRRTG